MTPALWLLAMVAMAAAITDLRNRRIPNWVTFPSFALGLILNAALHGWIGLGSATAGAGLAILIYLPLFLIRAVGAGDLKLMAAMGAIAGPRDWMALFLFTALAGGVLALAVTLVKGRLRRTLRNTGLILRELASLRAPYHASAELDVSTEAGVRLPHAVSILVGTVGVLLARIR